MGTNMSWSDNVSSPFEPIEAINTQTGGGFGLMIIISSFLISFITLRYYGKEVDEILIYCGAFEFLLVGLFIVIQWIEVYYIMFPVALLFAGILVTIFSKK